MSSTIRNNPAKQWRVGALRELLTRPLYHTLKSSSGFPGELLFDIPSVHLDGLMTAKRDAAFVAPIDFAQNSSGMILYPGIGVSSIGESGVVRLYVRREANTIASMAVGNVSTTDVVLSRIILTEKYEAEPVLVPSLGTVEEMLVKADCALVSGDSLLTMPTDLPFIDIVDEWTDITELPFVHSLCMARSETFSPDLKLLLTASRNAGMNSIPTIADELAVETGFTSDLLRGYLNRFSYGFNELSRQSLEEFFTMAFYYGILGDVPEISFG